MTTAVADRSAVPAHASPFTATVASEWVKLWTVPFTVRMLMLAFALTAGAAAVFTLTTTVTADTALADMTPIEAAATSLLGADLAALVTIMLSAATVASEYSTGMIQLTLAATPRRWKPVLAKAVVLTVTALAVGAVATPVAFGVGRVVLIAQGVAGIAPDDPQLLRLMAGSALMAPFYSLLAVALAFVVRNTGGAVAIVLAVMSVPTVVDALSGWWRTLLPWLPASALHSVSGSTTPDAAEYLPPGAAGVVLAVWAGLFLAAAIVLVTRRDA